MRSPKRRCAPASPLHPVPGRSRPLWATGHAPGHCVAMMHACALTLELRIRGSMSLKDKRTVVKHLVETCMSRFGVAAAEVGYQEQWQRSELGFAAVAGSPGHVEKLLDSVEKYVWSHPGLEVLATGRSWLESSA